MQVYGDPCRSIDLASWRERVAAPMPGDGPVIVRHGELAARLIEAGQLYQAATDHCFDQQGTDGDPSGLEPLRVYLLRTAQALGHSWFGSGQAFNGGAPPVLPDWLPPSLAAREPEGYGFYGLYPETYFEAARRAGPMPEALVIGLRSIGTSLAAMVAAGLGSTHFSTVRPHGPVFARRIASADLPARLAQSRNIAIVDEGPGLSGSSFSACARFVAKHAGPHHLHLFPSHANGPGAQADAATRALFDGETTHLVPFEDAVPQRLSGWVADLTGRACAPLIELSAGRWRERRLGLEENWPAVDAAQERRKFLLHAEGGSFFLKFIGLGRGGQAKVQLAQKLATAGFAPECLGYRHGFSVERWHGEARAPHARRDRDTLLNRAAAYLAWRSRHLPATSSGASLAALRAMAARNLGLALGEAHAADVHDTLAGLHEWQSHWQPVLSDNRLHLHEWLFLADGRILKADANDHHASHDLIGPQDVAYDAACLANELDLDVQELGHLARAIERAGAVSKCFALLPLLRIVALAFEFGRLKLAHDAAPASPEAGRLRSHLGKLVTRVPHLLRDGQLHR